MAIRLPVLLAGLLLGWLVYAYGMFHTIFPTWSEISDVANCGDSPAAKSSLRCLIGCGSEACESSVSLMGSTAKVHRRGCKRVCLD